MMLKHAELYCTFPCSTSVRKYVHVLYFNWKVLRIKRPVSDNSCRTLEISKFFSFILFSTFFRHQGLFMMIVQKYCALKEKELRPSRSRSRQCCYSFRCISRRESSLHACIKEHSYSTSIRRSNSGGLKKHLSF